MTTKLTIGLLLVAPFASHAITGLLANVGWYRSIGIDFEPWYADAAYQSWCWFAMGVGLTLLGQLFVAALSQGESEGDATPHVE